MWTFRREGHQGAAGVISGHADTLEAALQGAWELCRHTEDAVIVYDARENGDPPAVARVSVEWLAG